MQSLLHNWFDDIAHPLSLLTMTSGGMGRTVVFLLVAARLAGFCCIGPLLGRTFVSWPVRIGLVGLLTLIVAPGLPLVDDASLLRQPEWQSLPGLIAAIACEAGIGAALGLAVAIFLSGLKLAGEWLDRHSGLGIGSVLNPEYSSGGSAPSELMCCFCGVVMLVMQPINGHLLVVRMLLDTFHAIPIGLASLPLSVFDLLRAMLQQSLVLGLRIVMPFVVVMSLLDLTLNFVRRSSRWELAPAAYAFRTAAALLILVATLPGIREAVSSSVRESLQTADETVLANESSP